MKAARVVPLRRIQGAPEEMADAALVAACAVGDTAALGALFDRHHLAVYRFVARSTGLRQDELDDVVQSTFMQVMTASRAFRGESAVRTWLFGIAVNIGRHHIRSEIRRRTALASVGEREAPITTSPHHNVERKQQLQILERAMAGLPSDQRVAFVMCDLEEIRGVDAARVLGIREGTLYRRLHDARKALRSALKVGTRD